MVKKGFLCFYSVCMFVCLSVVDLQTSSFNMHRRLTFLMYHENWYTKLKFGSSKIYYIQLHLPCIVMTSQISKLFPMLQSKHFKCLLDWWWYMYNMSCYYLLNITFRCKNMCSRVIALFWFPHHPCMYSVDP